MVGSIVKASVWEPRLKDIGAMSAITFPWALTVLEICVPLTVYNVVIFCVVSRTVTSAGRFENVGIGTEKSEIYQLSVLVLAWKTDPVYILGIDIIRLFVVHLLTLVNFNFDWIVVINFQTGPVAGCTHGLGARRTLINLQDLSTNSICTRSRIVVKG